MPYATATELLKRFDAEEIAQRTDRSVPRLVSALMLTTAAAGGNMSGFTQAEQDATAAALAVVNKALEDADDEINARIASRYQVPLASAPKIVHRYACDLARFYLYEDQATEQIEKRHEEALKFLDAVGKGRISIGPDNQGAPAAPSGDAAQMESKTPVFRRDSSTDFI